MPRGRIPSLISSSSGKPRFVTAKKSCSCSRCKKDISSGEVCVEIPKVGGAYTNWKRCCLDCFQTIIEQTDKDFKEIKQGLAEALKN